jgi:putative redox protein
MSRVSYSKHSIVATPRGGAKFNVSMRGHDLLTDQPERMGGDDTGPTPLELLGASLAGCIALYVHRYCESESLEADDLAIEVKPFWRENPGRVARYDVSVHLPDTIPSEYYEAIAQVAQKCPVHHTLTHIPEITLQLRAESAVPA